MSAVGSSSGAVVRQGHLRKLKTMKKKFFVLREETPDCSARLEYYESEKKFKVGASPRRVLSLKCCYNIMRRLDLKQKHVIALFTREEQFCVVAENELDLHGWLAAILKQHRSDDASEELLHPIQHVWQVNVQKKGLGASKNIQGLYNLCLTDKTLSLVKIKSHNNVISDLGIPERVEYSLKNIRRCGDSECFFYMEVGRQTTTGAGELWMLSDDSNIAQSMHSTIYHAMRNCAKELEHERDHIVIPKNTNESSNPLPARRQTYSDGRGRAGLNNDVETLRNRCVTMPSRACASFEIERPTPKFTELEGLDLSRDEPDAVTEWHRTPRIPEEPDCCDVTKESNDPSMRTGGSVHHSRTSSLGVDDSVAETLLPDGYLSMAPGYEPQGGPVHNSRTSSLCLGDSLAENMGPEGYLPMGGPNHDHHRSGLVSASSGSVCSGTPSTDPRFSEYQLDHATSYIGVESRPPRAYSVGSRPPSRAPPAETRHRAYSVGARHRPLPHNSHSARANAEDHMELDFSNNSPAAKISVSQTPPTSTINLDRPKPAVQDEYVDMSPHTNAGYVEMRPGEPPLACTPPVYIPSLPTSLMLACTPPSSMTSIPSSLMLACTPPFSNPSLTPAQTVPDGYVEMDYGRTATRPITIAGARTTPYHPQPLPSSSSPPTSEGQTRRRAIAREGREARTPHGSQTLFPMSLDSPASPVSPPDDVDDLEEDPPHQQLSTVREISEDGRATDVSSSPQYVTLVREPRDELSCNPTANKTIARIPEHDGRGESISGTAATVVATVGAGGARFSVGGEDQPSPSPPPTPLNYAALDLEPRRAAAAPHTRTYTQIDFIRSEKLHAADGT